MNYIKITKNDIANGEGVRVTLWLSGCSHNCKGCHNPQTHNPDNGILFDEKAETEIFQELIKPYISGITLSGGDPLHENNLEGVLNLINKIRLLFGDSKTIWIYSGYTLEECQIKTKVCDENIFRALRHEIINHCDVLVDGKYIDDLRDITLKWRGSSNQRVIDAKQTINNNKLTLYAQ